MSSASRPPITGTDFATSSISSRHLRAWIRIRVPLWPSRAIPRAALLTLRYLPFATPRFHPQTHRIAHLWRRRAVSDQNLLVSSDVPTLQRVVPAENLISGKGLGSDVVQSRVGAAARGMRLTDLKVAVRSNAQNTESDRNEPCRRALNELVQRRARSGGESLVTMMQATDLREHARSPTGRRLDGTRIRAVFSQR